jgi:predicted nucleic acid-binding protein
LLQVSQPLRQEHSDLESQHDASGTANPATASIRLIIDTNILVGDWLSSLARARPTPILQGALAGRWQCLVSDALLEEWNEVLRRPAIRGRHRQDDAAIDTLIDGLVQRAVRLEPPRGPRAPDDGDQMLWDLLAAEPQAVLLTLDALLLRNRRMRGRVWSPDAWLLAAAGNHTSFISPARCVPLASTAGCPAGC